MPTLNINNLGNAQAIGWADALITRNAAGRVGIPALSLSQGTITAAAAIIDAAGTWNNAGVTFTAIKANITDTASNAASLLMDLQVGGTSRFQVDKLGNCRINPAAGQLLDVGGTNGLGGIRLVDNGSARVSITPSAISVASTLCFQFTPGNSAGVGDVKLFRDDTNTLAQRNDTNAQAFRLYNTYTDASNYERAKLRWNSNVFEIGVESGGTGTVRVVHISGLPTSNPGPGILWNNAGTPAIGT